MKRILACLLLAAGARAADVAYPPPGFEVHAARESWENRFKIVDYRKANKGGSFDAQIWVETAGGRPQHLFDCASYGCEILIAPDDAAVAFNHKVGSNLAAMELFSVGSDNRFRRVDCEKGVLQRIQGGIKMGEAAEFARAYWHADAWLPGGLLFGHFSGRWDDPALKRSHEVRAWYFIYDVHSGEVTLDLEKLNHRGISERPWK